MLINFQELRKRLKSTGLKVYRNKSPVGTPYPYIVYSYVSESRIFASSKEKVRLIQYQVSLFTKGTEKDLLPLESALRDVPYTPFRGVLGDENDDTVTNFFTYVELGENIER